MRVFILLALTTLTSFGYAQINQENSPGKFIHEEPEFENFIKDNFVRPDNALLYGVNAKMKVSFLIDSIGGIDSVQIIHYESIMVPYISNLNLDFKSIHKAYKAEAKRVMKYSAGLWYPASISGNYVNAFDTIEIVIQTENYQKRKDELQGSARIGEMLDLYSQNQYSAKPDMPFTSAEKYYDLGVKKYKEKLFFLALKYFNTSVELDDKVADTWYNLGLTHYQLDNKVNACQCWVKSMRLGDEGAVKIIEEYCK